VAEFGLRERKKQQVRERILEVCGRLFRSRGFDATTIDDIVAEVEISRQSFFNYFAGKDAVLAELGLAWLRTQADAPRRGASRARGRSVLGGARRSIRGQLRAIEQDRDFMRIVFTRSGLFFPQGVDVGGRADEARIDQTRNVFDAIAALMRAGQETGEIRKDVPAQQAAELYVSVMLVTIRLWLIDYWGAGPGLVTRGMRALDVLERGLRAEPDAR
jgi:AcrR family transcriptional regulator